MTERRVRIFVMALVALVCFGLLAIPAHADVQITLTGPPGPNGLVAQNIYMNPYVATINGDPGYQVICDDFLDEVYTGETWNARVNRYDGTVDSLLGTHMATVSTLTGTNLLNAYAELAWLSDQLLTTQTVAGRINLSFAIWSVFEPAAVATRVDNGPDTEIADWLRRAQNNIEAGRDILGKIYIYSPEPPISGVFPQEMLRVDPPTVSEASSAYILAFEFSVLLAAALLFRRRLAGGRATVRK